MQPKAQPQSHKIPEQDPGGALWRPFGPVRFQASSGLYSDEFRQTWRVEISLPLWAACLDAAPLPVCAVPILQVAGEDIQQHRPTTDNYIRKSLFQLVKLEF